MPARLSRLARLGALVFALFGALLCAGTAVAQPVKVADEVVERIETPRPYPRSYDPATPSWSAKFSWPDAAFIVVRFETFDLAPGDQVVLRDPTGTQRHVYSGRGLQDRGGNFWGLSIFGDTLIVELYTRSEYDDRYAGIAIDRWTHGYPQSIEPGAEAICGANDAKDHECYRTSHPTEFQKARAAIRLLKNGAAHCTGWIASCENHIMTNQHCVATQSELDQIEFQFEYRRPNCNSGTAAVDMQLQGGTLLSAYQPLDYALILPNLAGNDPQSKYGFLQWDIRTAIPEETIYIPGHPNGVPKRIALESTDTVHDQSGRCEVWSTTEPACQSGGPPDVGYYCDTEGGSSGSAVLALSSHKVIALHHCASCPNRGVPILNVYNYIQATPNPLPACSTCNPGASPTNLTADSPHANSVHLNWSAVAGAVRYHIYRSTAGCATGFQKIGTTTNLRYDDMTVSGGVTYSYHVKAENSCGAESAPSNCQGVTPTGRCADPPTFGGLLSATNSKSGTCGTDLAWAPAIPQCGSSVRYNVYGSSTAGFVPGASNRLASCVSGNTWHDAGMRSSTTFSYVVRAEDNEPGGTGPCRVGNEDRNTVERTAAPTGPDDVMLAAGFETATGWTLEGEWQIGAPQGRGGTAGGGSGSPDPATAFAGTGVLGTDLSGLGAYLGNYEDNITTPQYATGPPFSGVGRTQALLRFQRRLGVETSTWDKATIDVFDGVSWQNVYTNPASSFSDASWVPQEIDITPHVAGRNNVRLRFGIQSDSSVRYCGWNVDALDVYQASACADGAVGVPPVADGRFARGVQMIARKTATPGALTVTWEAGRCPADNYHLLWGRGTDVAAYTYQGAACALGVSGTATTGAVPDPAPGAFNWWLIAGVRGTTEGHHGFRSNGTVRPASGVGRCSISAHDGAGTCP